MPEASSDREHPAFPGSDAAERLLMASAATRLVESDDDALESVLRDALGQLARYAGADASRLALLGEGGGEARPREQPARSGLAKLLESRESWLGARLRAGETVEVRDPASLPPGAEAERTALAAEGLRALVVAPLVAESELVGWLSLAWRGEPTTPGIRGATGLLRWLGDCGAAGLRRRQRTAAQRRDLERRMQTAKLEALARLASGAAHDFNNLLAAILGFAELGQLKAGSSRVVASELEQIVKVADRAVALTRQLLAFASRQDLKPTPQPLAGIVRVLAPELARLAGADVAVELEIEPAAEATEVLIDRSQLELVLRSLVANACDAMQGRGRLRIEVRVASAEALRLVIRDSGCGMDRDTLARACDPFFTTKPRGKGKGLGLAMALGIVQQSGGELELRSEPGRGTEVSVRLPRASLGASAARSASENALVGAGAPS